MGWCLSKSSLGRCIHIVIFKLLPIPLSSFGVVKVLVVICAHLVGLFCAWCFCPPGNLVSRTYLYRYHIEFPNSFLCMGVFFFFLLSCAFGCSRKIGVLTVCGAGYKNINLQVELMQCTYCLIFETLLVVSICITLHLGQYSMARFKFAFNANFAISMQVCTFSHGLLYFNQAAISCNGRPCLRDT